MIVHPGRQLTFTILLMLTCFGVLHAQQYTSQWKNIQTLESKGLYKTALSAVKQVYERAKKAGDRPEQIKALIYEMKYNDKVKEDALAGNIRQLTAEATTAPFPEKEILQSMLAEMYWNYLQQNRYRLYSLTPVQNYSEGNISTWSVAQLNKKITELYCQSVKQEERLCRIKTDSYDTVVIKGENTAGLRPTLYDLLAHRAVDYFLNDERTVTQPANRFELDDPDAFTPASRFAGIKFPAKDTASLSYQAILLLQRLIRFHLHDTDPAALLDADIQRLQNMYQLSVAENKDSLYLAALDAVTAKYGQSPASAQAGYLAAQLYYQWGNEYQPFAADTIHRWDIKKAKERCEAILKKFPASEGAILCQSLLRSILEPRIGMQTEKVNIPGQPFRTLVTYKNVAKIYFRLMRIPGNDYEKIARLNDTAYWTQLTNLMVYDAWSLSFPSPGDYRQHTAEIKVESLPIGNYVLVASEDSNFLTMQNPLASQFFYVSDISYVGGNQGNYFVLNRETGQPLKGAGVQVWEDKYDYSARTPIFQKAEAYTTDADGHFKIAGSKDYRSVRLEFTWQKDHLFTGDYAGIADNRSTQSAEQGIKPQTFIFTDRSVYRPGQVIWFKGIVLKTDPQTHQSAVLPEFKTMIYLYDVNWQMVDSLPVTTNEWGSYAGSFALPQALLNGQMHLQDTKGSGQAYFSVEAYKRPKFYVALSKPASGCRLKDTIRVSGDVKAYAGAVVAGAGVRYRVVRLARFPFFSYYRRFGPVMPSSPQAEIAQGATTTDGNGKFIIPFTAIPDRSIPENRQPVFDYAVYADVTDINGETQSGMITIPVGYRSLELSISLPPVVEADSLQHIAVTTTNLSGQSEPADVNVSLYKLKPPGRVIRERYWQQPDQYVMSRADYLKDFPHDEYGNEADPVTWQRTDKVWQQSLTTSAGSHAGTGTLQIAPGWYAVEAVAKDPYGREVKEVKYVQVYNNTMQSSPFGQMVWGTALRSTVSPGERAGILMGTPAKDLYLVQQIARMKGQEDFSILHLHDEVKKILLPVQETDRGGIGYHYFFVKDNRLYTGNISIAVPWDNKQLNISYETFRDKLLPGAREEWKLKVSGSNGNRVTAEMLVTMYDASLDAFRPHAWPVLNLYPLLTGPEGWNGGTNFSAGSGPQYFRRKQEKNSFFKKTYDQLNWFGYLNSIPRFFSPRPVGDMQFSAVSSVRLKGTLADTTATNPFPSPAAQQDQPVQIRQNLQETAFFYPQLQTDSSGKVVITYTVPEALTKWKFMAFAHTKDMAYGFSEKEVVTQKQLMVMPNPPRFFREGDQAGFSTKIVNLSGKALTGEATLELLDPETQLPVDTLFKNNLPVRQFSAAPGQSIAVNWPLTVPLQYHRALVWRIVAKAGNYSDGEENALPVLTNDMLVTETLPLPVRNEAVKSFRFDKLLHSGESGTLRNYSLTVEFTSNPAWYAVQALPSLSDVTNGCAEQLFNRYYANALAAHIAYSSPEIEKVFQQWSATDTTGLQSNLEKNEALKPVLLQQTPWVLEAKNETERKHRIAMLFDPLKMKTAIAATLQQLESLQTPNGGFSWFAGMPDDRYITQYILSGMGHLRHLQAITARNEPATWQMVNKAIRYLDTRLKEDYDNLLKKKGKMGADNLENIQVQYLYMRSFFKDIPVTDATRPAYAYYLQQAQQYWLNRNAYMQAMIALVLSRNGNDQAAGMILRSLKETAIRHPETGMYWKDMAGGYYWYQAPVEAASVLVEAFSEAGQDAADVEAIQTWLLKQKQTQNWATAKATADAVYALLLTGKNWLTQQPAVTITLGKEVVHSQDENAAAGAGYFQKRFADSLVKPDMGNITVKITPETNKNPASTGIAWGGVYWQYFEQLDKITAAATPLRIQKQLFVEGNTDRGPMLTPVKATQSLKVGDKLKVRILLQVDRDMEYVDLRDMRAACFEPVNVLSGYRWQNGAGYYVTNTDVSTDFFFDRLPRGTYVFEYALFVTAKGNFSNGISTVQCLYAPEFSSHSGGIRIKVN